MFYHSTNITNAVYDIALGKPANHNPVDVPLLLIKASRCFLHQESLPHCLVLVGYRGGSERDFPIELQYIESLMEDWRLTC